MSVVLRIYENAERSEYTDMNFDSEEAALSKMNAYGSVTDVDRIFWGHGFTIYNESGEPIRDVIYPEV